MPGGSFYLRSLNLSITNIKGVWLIFIIIILQLLFFVLFSLGSLSPFWHLGKKPCHYENMSIQI